MAKPPGVRSALKSSRLPDTMAEEESSNGQSAISKEKFLEMKNALDKDGDGSVDKVTSPALRPDAIMPF